MSLAPLELDGQRAVVTLDRPRKRNALSPELLTDLIDSLTAASEHGPRVLVLNGEGPVFCAGGDIEAMQDRLGDPTATREALTELLNPAVATLRNLPVPTVARVQGAAVGAGLGLALACDVTVTTQAATLGAVHTRLGLTPDGGTTWLLTRLLGPKQALAMILAAETITGAEAQAMGLVTDAVAEEELDEATEAWAARLAEGPTQAFLKARELVDHATQVPFEASLEQEALSQALMYATEDQQEGVRAFLEKRDAEFEGR